jgi:hypothetical protein
MQLNKTHAKPYVPTDALERVGTIVDIDEIDLTICFPGGVENGSDLGETIRVLRDPPREAYVISKARLLEKGFPEGPRGGRMVNTKDLFNYNFDLFQPHRASGRYIAKAYQGLAKKIKQDGLRHPIVLNRNLDVLYGKTRLYACNYLKMEEVETFIVDTDLNERGYNDQQRSQT